MKNKEVAVTPEVLSDHELYHLELKHPVKWGKDEVTELEFKPIKGKHLKNLDFSVKSIDAALTLASRLSGRPSSFFDEMAAADIFAVGDRMGKLLENSP